MQTILYLIPSMVTSQQSLSRVIEKTLREGAELIACFIISRRVPESVSSWLIYIGFMGDKPSDDLKSAISDHYRQRARAQLDEIKLMADRAGIDCRTRLEEGNVVEIARQIVREENVDLVLFGEPDRADFDHLVFGPIHEELVRQLECPVLVVDEKLLYEE